MNKFRRASIFLFCALIIILLVLFAGCQSGTTEPEPIPTVETTRTPDATTPAASTTTPPPSTTPEPENTKIELTLDDSKEVLELLSILPDSFTTIDAESMGITREKMGFPSDCSEFEAVMSVNPVQMIAANYCLLDSETRIAVQDAMIKDEKLLRNLLESGIKMSADIKGIDVTGTVTNITYPKIGDLAVIGEGTMSAKGQTMGYDLAIVRAGKVSLTIISVYFSKDRHKLTPLAEAIVDRIKSYNL